jgi:hypothetical protein
LLGYAISNWKNPADRAVALQNNVQLEEKNWPELSFWRTVWNFQQGNATVQDIYENTFTALPPANPALGGYTDPFWINFFSSAGSNTTTTPPASGGTTFNAPAKQFSAKETEICKANSGWISLEEKNCLRELLLSLEAYEQIGKELFQIVVKSAKITPFLKDGEYLYNLEIEYERSYQNSFFSVHVPESSANPVILPQPLTWDNMEVSFDDMEITFDQIEY